MTRKDRLRLQHQKPAETPRRIAVPLILASLALLVTAALYNRGEEARIDRVAAKPAFAGPRITYPVGRSPTVSMPDGRQRAVRSVLNVDKKMKFGDFVWRDTDVPPGPVWVRVDLGRQILSVFRGGHEIGSAVILYGTDGTPTPTGTFPILAKAREHQSNLYEADMPFMLRLTNDGVALHASAVVRGSATHGCVGLPIAFAEKLFDAVKTGDEVAIVA